MSAHAMPAKPGKRKLTLRRAVDDGFTYLALTVVSLIFLLPCLWLILASLSKSGSLYEIHGFFPAEYSLKTFVDLFTDDVNGLYPYRQWFINTLYVASMSCVFGTVLVILTGYVMSRFRFKGRNAIKNLTLVLGMFPGFMGMTAIYIIMAQLGLLNRLEALIFLYAGTAPMGYLVQKGYFDTIPATIHEAARIDGATNLQIFTKITLPLSKPMIVYTALTQFAWPWSDCLLPKLLLKNRDQWTVAVGLFSMPETHFSRFAAGIVAMSMNSCAYVAEIIRSGIQAVDYGQTEAARSLGFRQSQTMTMVVLPQAVKNILPALGNEFVTVIKESSIVSVIGIADLMFRSKDVIAVTYISLETLAIAAILYFIMTFISGRFVSLMERKMSNGTK